MDRPPVDVEGILHSGEESLGVVRLDPTRFVVTTHRLIVVSPEGPGKRLETIHLPNVDGVEAGTTGGGNALQRLPRVVVYGGIFLVGGWAIRTMVLPKLQTAVPGAGQGIVGSVTGVLGAVQTGLSILSLVLILGGGLALLGAVGLVGLYAVRRRSALLIQRADAAPIACRAETEEVQRAAAEVTAAIEAVTDRATSAADG